MLKLYQQTICSNCKTTSNQQPIGDGCHVCLCGYMKPRNKK